jgi:microcystin-dependent protein
MANTALRRGSQQEGNTDYFTGCPIGGGFIWFGLPDKIPANCRICENQTFAISQFAKLYENLGNSWGESGGNMNIPDLRGRFPRGVDGGVGRDPDRAGRAAANAGGNTGDNVGSAQQDAMQGHFHQGYQGNGNTGNSPSYGSISSQPFTVNPTYPNSPVTDGSNGAPRISSESRPQNANVYFVIRVE